MKKLLIIASLILVLLLGAVVTAWWWLTTTRAGAEWVLSQATRVAPGLEWDRMEGGLAGGITLHGLRFVEGDLVFEARQAQLAVRVQPRLRPQVRIAWIRIDDADLRLPEPEDPPPDREPFQMPDLDLPVDIHLDQFRLRDLRIWTWQAEEPLQVDEVSFAGRAGESVVLERLEVRALGARLRGELTAGLEDPWPLDGRLNLSYQPDPEGREQTLSLELSGDLDVLDLAFRARGPVDAAGRSRIVDVLDEPGIEVELESDRAGWPRAPVQVRDLELTAQGDTSAWGLDSRFRLLIDDVPDPVAESTWVLEVRGAGERIELRSGRVDVLSGHLDLSGELILTDPLQAQANVEIVGLDVAPLYPDLPVEALISGRLDARYSDNAVELRAFELRAPPTTLELTGSGYLRPESDEVDLEINWTDFTWPPVATDEPALVRSSQGRLLLDGQLSDWRAQLEALLESPNAPEARVSAEVFGDMTRAEIRQARLETDSGELRLTGWVDWEDQLRAQANVTAQGLDPAIAVRQLPGRLDADLGVALAVGETVDLELDIRSLEGQIRGRPLSGSGRLTLHESRAGPGQLTLNLGDNRLSLGSEQGEAWDLQLTAGRLDQLWPDLAGSLELAGTVDPALPAWQLSGRGDDLRFDDFLLEQLTLETEGSLAEGADQIALRLELANLDLNPWERVDTFVLAVDGSCRNHEFDLSVDATRARVALTGSGSLQDCLPDAPAWEMDLATLALSDTPAGDWQLVSPARFELDGPRVRLDDFCLQPVDPRAARLCIQDLQQDVEGGRARIELVELPVDLLLVPLGAGLRLGNELDGHLEARWSQAGLEEADGLIQVGRGWVQIPGQLEQSFTLDGGQIRLETPRPGQIEFDARMDGQADSVILARGRLSDSRDLANAEFEDGMISFQAPELAPLGYLVPEVDRIAGALELEVEFEGPVTRPRMNGRLALRDGEVENVPLGMHFRDIQIDSHSEPGRLFVNGGFQAGEGRGTLEAVLGLDNGAWFAETSINGADLDLFSVEWLSLRVSPDFSVRLDPDETRIGGRIDIPRARIGLPPGLTDRVSESGDVVLVGAQREEPEPAVDPARLTGSLTIGLGDDVRFNGAGARARLAGSTELNWTGEDLIPLARGTIRLPEGSYRDYGQNLELRDSRVVFGNRPANDPVLEIEAIREIFGDPQVEVAGVRIRGSANNPEVQLFTDPPTTEEKALAYIVTGADFDHAAGVGALSFGLYLLPDLFVSYGVGLFDTGNVLSARYELSRRWGVRVESGERDTGVDFSFQLNR